MRETKPGCERDCAVERAIGIIGGKWKLYIIRVLLVEGPLRFNRLLEAIEGISPKVLTQNLRELEQAGVIQHEAPQAPYAVTGSGQRLMGPLHALGEWADQHQA
ncbi:MAG: helix-turn-helix domain-containing protein [Myxococcota bacterium]